MQNKVIAATRSYEEIVLAAKSDVSIVFDLNPDILSVCENIRTLHDKGKKLFVHLDLADGIGKDRSGIVYLKNAGVDGIISTRSSIIKTAHELGLATVQRFFIVDSHSVDTTVESLKTSKAQMIEVMPGGVAKIVKKLKAIVNVPIIAGGLIETKEELESALESGAFAVSTGARALWNVK